eukprot:3767839-Amphidinium_carterae.1
MAPKEASACHTCASASERTKSLLSSPQSLLQCGTQSLLSSPQSSLQCGTQSLLSSQQSSLQRGTQSQLSSPQSVMQCDTPVSYTHLRAHETEADL